jgi:hypothetical protein
MKGKRIIMLWGFICVLVLALSIPPMLLAAADDDDDCIYGNRRCKLQGTWILGDLADPFSLMITYQGTGDNEGTEAMEFVRTIEPLPPDTRLTGFRGVWVKSGHRSYDYATQGYFVGLDNQQVYLVMIIRGTITLTSCNTMEAIVTTEYYIPGVDEMYSSISGSITGRRLLVDQATPIQ